MSVLNARVALKGDTDANWALVEDTFVPLAREQIFYSTSKRFKMGDGSSTLAELAFLPHFPIVSAGDAGKILKVNSAGVWVAGDETAELPVVTNADAGKILAVNGSGAWVAVDPPTELPAVTSSDDGKILVVDENGDWVVGDAPAGVTSYNELTDTPMWTSQESYTQEDSIGTGTFMGSTFSKVSADVLTIAKMLGGEVTNSGNTITLTAANTMDVASAAGAMGFGGTSLIVITPGGNWQLMDEILISLDDAWSLPAYGIDLTAGTYIASTVSLLALPEVVEINPDFAGQLLPVVSEADNGAAMEVVGGKWIKGALTTLGGVEDWNRLQRMLRGSMNPVIFPVWSQIRVPHKVYGNITFDVVAHDIDLDPNDNSRHTMTLLMRDCIPRMFDQVEAMAVCPSGLTAGTYYFDGTSSNYSDMQHYFEFTLTEAVPADGCVCFDLDVSDWTLSSVSTYNSISATTPIETVQFTQTDSQPSSADIASAVGVGNVNHPDRAAYGSNNWQQSNVRQWLNGTGNGWWVSKTKFDRPPVYVNDPAFLAGFPAEFISTLVETEQSNETNYVFETDMTAGSSENHITYTTTDKFFLPSFTQVGGNQWSSQLAQNNKWTAFADVLPSSANDDLVKYDFDTRRSAWWYWQRSCNPYYANYVRDVYTDGYPNNSSYAANPFYGVAAACVIGAL